MITVPPMLGREDPTAAPRTYGVEPRCVQTSGVFRLPAELIVEILSNFGDPHCNILRERSDRGSGILVVEHMERLTVIRKLTMTCWDLRNALFPLLWQYVEGCNVYLRSDPMAPSRNGLYDQCSYLAHNPTVGAHVQTLFADLRITDPTKDLSTIFIDCLVRLPNLRTLEIFSASVSLGTRLERECARFPSIRELRVEGESVPLAGCCPNVESVTVTSSNTRDIWNLCLCGNGLKRLKRVAGRAPFTKDIATEVAQVWPGLQEICIQDRTGKTHMPIDVQVIEHLRSFKHLAVVDLNFLVSPSYPEKISKANCRRFRTEAEMSLKVWKGSVIEVLKDCPSKDRKFLRWRLYESERCLGTSWATLVQEGELEALPGVSL